MKEKLNRCKAFIVRRVGLAIIRVLEWFIVKFSAVPTTPFLDPSEFAWTKNLEANWQTIQAELKEILKYHAQLPNFQEISRDQTVLTNDDNWKTFFFYAFGRRALDNCDRCPETTKLIEAVPGMKTAFFSILSPGKHIPPHRGPFKGVLRYHLGLIVPEPKEKCRIRVDDEVRYWQEGHSLLFDDSYQHEAWNETEGLRVVLFMDVERPMRFPGSWLNKLIIFVIKISPFVADGVKNNINWEKKFEKFMQDEHAAGKTA